MGLNQTHIVDHETHNWLNINGDGSVNVRLTDGTDFLLINADGSINVNVADLNTEGGIDKLNVYDESSRQLLTDILREIKQTNLHLSVISGIDYNKAKEDI